APNEAHEAHRMALVAPRLPPIAPAVVPEMPGVGRGAACAVSDRAIDARDREPVARGSARIQTNRIVIPFRMALPHLRQTNGGSHEACQDAGDSPLPSAFTGPLRLQWRRRIDGLTRTFEEH